MGNIRLAIERFWMEYNNFELWANVLTYLPEKLEVKSAKELAQVYLYKNVEGNNRRLDRSKEIFGLMGSIYHSKAQEIEIKGVRLIELQGEHLVLTEDAKALIYAYKEDNGWELLLAKQLLRYSPRVRVLFSLLWKGAYFNTENAKLEQLSRWKLIYKDCIYQPFASKESDMNLLLGKFKEEALGPYWKRVFIQRNIELREDWKFVGSQGSEPAKSNLSSLMHSPFTLFDYLGWLRFEAGGRVSLLHDRVRDDIDGEELFEAVEDLSTNSLLSVLKEVIHENQDYRGFFPVEPTLNVIQKQFYPEWNKGLDRFVDYFITTGVQDGLFIIEDYESGQPRHGRGYLNRREYQLIRLYFYK
ncbi:hypothetical protein [Priestia megaterium]|uniref:hypothetical protein n=1 Tax=Priestia megaterium TaxID=1404 RepID=UPI003008831B